MAKFLVGDCVTFNKSLNNVPNQILKMCRMETSDADILQRLSKAVLVIMKEKKN